MHEPLTDQLERSPTAPGLAAQSARLVAAPECRGLGRQRRRSQPVDAARPRRRPGGPAPSASLWSAPAVGRRPAGASARAVAPRRRGLWLPGPSVDLWPDRGRDAPGVGRLLSPRPCRSLAEDAALEPTKARTTGSAARRRGDCLVARGGLACTQKGAQAQGQTIFFIDESGFYPLPSVVRTYAPIGRTPILQEWWTRDHLSAISAISAEGKLYFYSQDCSLDSDDVVAFLEHLLREVPGQMVIIWDGAHPPQSSHHRVPGPWRGATAPCGAPSRLCPGAEPRRGPLGPSEGRRTPECVLLHESASAP
jgi:DDE superfamily endonuclease